MAVWDRSIPVENRDERWLYTVLDPDDQLAGVGDREGLLRLTATRPECTDVTRDGRCCAHREFQKVFNITSYRILSTLFVRVVFEAFLYEAVRASSIIGGNIFQRRKFCELFPE